MFLLLLEGLNSLGLREKQLKTEFSHFAIFCISSVLLGKNSEPILTEIP